MARLSKQQATELMSLHGEMQFYGTEEKGYTDSGFFKFLPLVKTFDSHDLDNPVKPIMGDRAVYLIIVALFMLACPLLALTKSRQMRFSWFTTAFGLWAAMGGPYRRVVYQSKKEKDAENMVTHGAKNPGGGRASFIHQNLPGWFRDDHIYGGSGS